MLLECMFLSAIFLNCMQTQYYIGRNILEKCFYSLEYMQAVVFVWQLDSQLPMQSVPITTNVVSSNPAHGQVYSIQHYVIKFVSDLRQVCFSQGTPASSTNKTDRHDITEISLKAVLDLNKERAYVIPLVRPLPIPHLHDWRKMEVYLINFNKGKDDEGSLKFCNILKWSASV